MVRFYILQQLLPDKFTTYQKKSMNRALLQKLDSFTWTASAAKKYIVHKRSSAICWLHVELAERRHFARHSLSSSAINHPSHWLNRCLQFICTFTHNYNIFKKSRCLPITTSFMPTRDKLTEGLVSEAGKMRRTLLEFCHLTQCQSKQCFIQFSPGHKCCF